MDRDFLEDLAAESSLDAEQVLRVAKELAKLSELGGEERGYGLTPPLGRSVDTQSAGLGGSSAATRGRLGSESR